MISEVLSSEIQLFYPSCYKARFQTVFEPFGALRGFKLSKSVHLFIQTMRTIFPTQIAPRGIRDQHPTKTNLYQIHDRFMYPNSIGLMTRSDFGLRGRILDLCCEMSLLPENLPILSNKSLRALKNVRYMQTLHDSPDFVLPSEPKILLLARVKINCREMTSSCPPERLQGQETGL